MVFLFGLGFVLTVYLTRLYRDYAFTKHEILSRLENQGLEFIDLNICFGRDLNNPFLKNDIYLKPKVLINGRPDGIAYRYFLVKYRSNNNKVEESFVELKSKIFGKRSITIESELR